MKNCICGNTLHGRQVKYCCDKCKNDKNQNYQTQQARGFKRKRELVLAKGGECEKCGYDRNLSSLIFHHINPKTKKRSLTLRECSNNKLEVLLEEAKKCKLLCHNCHGEEHQPHYNNWK